MGAVEAADGVAEGGGVEVDGLGHVDDVHDDVSQGGALRLRHSRRNTFDWNAV